MREHYNLLEPRMTKTLTAILEREGDGFTALCPELDIASQGDTLEAAKANLHEAVELFFESADQSETAARLSGEIYVTQLEVEFA